MRSTVLRKPAPAKKSPSLDRQTGKLAGAAKARVVRATARKPTTIRLDPSIEKGLQILQAACKRPVNKIVNEALAEYIDKGTARLEADFEEALDRLKEYRRSDPGFKRAVRAFVDAEVACGAHDPVEGRPIPREVGPAVTMVRERLRD